MNENLPAFAKCTGPAKLIVYDKQELLNHIVAICNMGWIPLLERDKTTKQMTPLLAGKKKDGAPGEYLENLLGITTNNLPIPNAGEWELKVQVKSPKGTSSLTTLNHMEPSPSIIDQRKKGKNAKGGIVTKLLIPIYGWQHAAAGRAHPADEKSFRATLSVNGTTPRGFSVIFVDEEDKVAVNFSIANVSEDDKDWLSKIQNEASAKNVAIEPLTPVPYWGISDIHATLSQKLRNCIYITAIKRLNKEGQFYEIKYETVKLLEKFSKDKLRSEIKNGNIYFDFDARSRHNHGTKIRAKDISDLYENVTLIHNQVNSQKSLSE
jgi:hypothetical protein